MISCRIMVRIDLLAFRFADLQVNPAHLVYNIRKRIKIDCHIIRNIQPEIFIQRLYRQFRDEKNLSVNEEVVKQSKEQKIMNIALYGVDSRNQDYKGRSDAIILLSLNGNTGKIKLVSIARDSYVSVPGHYDTKINHAYAYGGPELAIRPFLIKLTQKAAQSLLDSFKSDAIRISRASSESPSSCNAVPIGIIALVYTRKHLHFYLRVALFQPQVFQSFHDITPICIMSN